MDWNKPVPLADLQDGEHIYVYVTQSQHNGLAGERQPGALAHHGIYIGGDEVVHFCGPSLRITALRGEPSEDGVVTEAGGSKRARSQVQDWTHAEASTAAAAIPSAECSLVHRSSLAKFNSLGRCDGDKAASTTASSDDVVVASRVRRYRYSVKRVEANYLSSYGTCTTLTRQPAEQVARMARFYAEHPRDFGEYEAARTSEHFAVFCSVCDEEVDETSRLATPPSLMVPLLSAEMLAATSPVAAAAPAPVTTKGKIAAAATATCGLVAAGTMWGVAPAVLIGGAVFASAKYVVGRKEEKEQMSQKKLD